MNKNELKSKISELLEHPETIDMSFVSDIRSGLLRNHIYKLQERLINYNTKLKELDHVKTEDNVKAFFGKLRKGIYGLYTRINKVINFLYIENNEDCSLCSECKGNCCNCMGCELSPYDVQDFSVNGILELLKKGLVTLDYWEGDVDCEKDELDKVYYLRSRNDNDDNYITASWGGKCANLVDDKCRFTFEERPSGGKYLVPHEGKCSSAYSKRDVCMEWRYFQDMLYKVIKEISNEEYPYGEK
jgi:hypothetical protein